ncbi:DUF255-domain-containing protein [Gloeophyllum trabeum ATCC 11539]|uniref:DUF255-domain-containing protein n=1 Tax=Gloeophyllum trabeum (strain ATCC 11539 / FP-39264 / Madison 617) TaxID=670483 RepID=S7PSJ2_GLOTA|nr:DUF255-domain-containing protein [Gloeophyllum trabeum ATCC 11539]EPQ50357.1 DUF255-domain-containing protein [Gloeophyllum trabeum ATCC 11539]
MTDRPKHTNRLSNETSPYLLQHQHNPVDWYPWGPEAFEKAKKEDKPIFLSVGYSTCRWCHVMERESFEDETVAKVMNDVCVNIKVDREVLPDIDRIYMMFVQATTGHGGWPMSVFLTPDLKPFFGGTYFPPGALVSILEQIDDKWHNSRSSVLESASKLHSLLSDQLSAPSAPESPIDVKTCVEDGLKAFRRRFDRVHGGFGGAPKFPTAPIFSFLHTKGFLEGDDGHDVEKPIGMAGFTLTKISRGGIHDHVGNGFHRYSVDAKWHVPHFEKMLYDQAQLTLAFLRQYTITSDTLYLDNVFDILEYSARDLYSPSHKAFYAAEDAESLPTPTSTKKEEGAFWVWTAAEIDNILGAGRPSAVFRFHYSVSPDGNVDPSHDPHGELKGKNILMERGSIEDSHRECVMEHPGLTLRDVEEILREGRQKLREVRDRERPRPHRDEKIVAAWNGMMGRALAWAARVVGERGVDEGNAARWYEMATDLVSFIERDMVLSDGRLRRVYGSDVEGVVDDYAQIISFLLALYQVRFEPKYLQLAVDLQAKQDALFWDQEGGGYFTSSSVGMQSGTKIMRLKDDQDGAEPSANSTALHNLITLDAIMHATSPEHLGLKTPTSGSFDFVEEYDKRATRLLSSFASMLEGHPTAVPDMLSSVLLRDRGIKAVILAGSSGIEEFVKAARGGRWEADVVYMKETVGTEDKVTGRVCYAGTCGLKQQTPGDLRQEIESAGSC